MAPESSMVPLPCRILVIGVLSRASPTTLARVACWEWGQSTGPLASATPRAILSNRLERAGPSNGVSRCDGNEPKVCLTQGKSEKEIRKRGKVRRKWRKILYRLWHPGVFWLGFCSEPSSWMELFQRSEHFLLASGVGRTGIVVFPEKSRMLRKVDQTPSSMVSAFSITIGKDLGEEASVVAPVEVVGSLLLSSMLAV